MACAQSSSNSFDENRQQLILSTFPNKVCSRLFQINLIICSATIFICIYVTAVSILKRPIIYPLINLNANVTIIDTVDHTQSAISVVLIWIAALIAGRITTYLRLPSLLGVLLCGVALRNIPFTAQYLFIDGGVNNFLRKSAFAVILIRGGIGLDWVALKKTKGVIFRFGVLSSVFEALVIALVAYPIFGMSPIMCIVFGICYEGLVNFNYSMTLAATSPAVTIPTMLGLSKKGYGNDSGVPTAILAAASIDNMICITLFNVFLSLITENDSTSLKIGLLVVQIIVGIIVGFGVGFLLWVFPRRKSRQVHFTRVALLFWLCMMFIFGTQAISWDSGGVIATILASFICSVRWKADNPQKDDKESEAFALMWNLVGMQVMFATIGFEFQFSEVNSKTTEST
ncbi:unnamed protein product [Anisakis simplex]|uniref:Na_H_Exchanger domain-containing protein n=1 Tax=Anisakis simplex TaxID=6269 RepID=A0A0M3IYE2_ANISI|nr:unnamed protein product [Anisakis simplex]